MSLEQIAAPFVGAVLLEVTHWYQIRNAKEAAKYLRLMKSMAYWLPTLAFTVVAPIAILIAFGHDKSAVQLLYLGASAPTVVRQVLGASVSAKPTLLGPGDDSRPTWRDYFWIGN